MNKTFWGLALIIIVFGFVACKDKPKPQTEEVVIPPTTEQKATNSNNNIILRDTDRNETTLGEELAKNKLTIVDFWASWCGPCRQEMPNVVSLYNEFSSKGLGIIGISLDEDNASWQKAIKELDMSWQQFSDLRGWEDGAAQHFGIRAIPHTIVFDENGEIIAQGLRGNLLRAFIAEKLE